MNELPWANFALYRLRGSLGSYGGFLRRVVWEFHGLATMSLHWATLLASEGDLEVIEFWSIDQKTLVQILLHRLGE